MIDLVYLTHNRREFTEASLEALIANTDWDLVGHVQLLDDRSTDGTADTAAAAARLIPAPTKFTSQRFGGPVGGLNHALDRTDADIIAKIDSDVIVCPRWLTIMAGVLHRYPLLDALGMEPGFGAQVATLDVPRAAKKARFVGGVGLFRTRTFSRHRPHATDRWFGLTEHWRRHASCGWVSPDLPCFLLDHMPTEPWRSLAVSYVERGWSRPWPPYPPSMAAYWDWWLAATRQAA